METAEYKGNFKSTRETLYGVVQLIVDLGNKNVLRYILRMPHHQGH